jgi:hypothetical protein
MYSSRWFADITRSGCARNVLSLRNRVDTAAEHSFDDWKGFAYPFPVWIAAESEAVPALQRCQVHWSGESLPTPLPRAEALSSRCRDNLPGVTCVTRVNDVDNTEEPRPVKRSSSDCLSQANVPNRIQHVVDGRTWVLHSNYPGNTATEGVRVDWTRVVIVTVVLIRKRNDQ